MRLEPGGAAVDERGLGRCSSGTWTRLRRKRSSKNEGRRTQVGGPQRAASGVGARDPEASFLSLDGEGEGLRDAVRRPLDSDGSEAFVLTVPPASPRRGRKAERGPWRGGRRPLLWGGGGGRGRLSAQQSGSGRLPSVFVCCPGPYWLARRGSPSSARAMAVWCSSWPAWRFRVRWTWSKVNAVKGCRSVAAWTQGTCGRPSGRRTRSRFGS